jgi:hypothetical protein
MPPLNFAPVWKEILPFDITSPYDVVKIKINNMAEQPGNRQLAEKTFMIAPAQPDPSLEEDNYDPMYELKQQRPIEDEIEISKSDGSRVGELKYTATWIYNKKSFLEDL